MIAEITTVTHKANGKSDDYLLRHFFAEFTNVS